MKFNHYPADVPFSSSRAVIIDHRPIASIKRNCCPPVMLSPNNVTISCGNFHTELSICVHIGCESMLYATSQMYLTNLLIRSNYLLIIHYLQSLPTFHRSYFKGSGTYDAKPVDCKVFHFGKLNLVSLQIPIFWYTTGSMTACGYNWQHAYGARRTAVDITCLHMH